MDYESTYKIKPLEWIGNTDDPTGILSTTIFGKLRIIFYLGKWEWINYFSDGDDDTWSDGWLACESLEDGKQKAEEFYLEKLKEALIKL